MTPGNATWTNVASGAAHVGVQAEAIHGDVTVYQLPPDASPEDKFRIGVNYLNGGMPTKARELIDEAIAMGYATSEAWFHSLLALLSGRTFQHFSAEDHSRLEAIRREPLPSMGDDWAEGVKVIFRLLDSMESSEGDLQLVLIEFDALGADPRRKIMRHLDLFLSGPLEDQMWRRELERARAEQLGGDRTERVWMFFEPRPKAPRVRPPAPVETTTLERFLAVAATVMLAAAAGNIGWVLLRRGSALALLAYLTSVAGGCICAVNGLEWRFRVERLRAREKQHLIPPRRASQPPSDGFAGEVDRLFSHYFGKYAPESVDRKVWLGETAGIRQYLRDEIVDAYRETRVKADQIAWLIRYRVTEVKQRWRNGQLRDYRCQFRTQPSTKVAFGAGLAALSVGGLWAIGNAMRAEPVVTSAGAVVAVASGWMATNNWLHIVLERRRYAAECEESQRRLADSQLAFDNWRAKLERTPADSEMATWLDCDRKVLMGEAMRRYKLTRSHVIAHAFIEAPAAGYKGRARVFNGPWRYSRYSILVFLLTLDGVRQVTADLDFQDGSFHDWRRTNYRFDAVASIQVSETDDHQRTFEMGLVSGQSINVRVTEATTNRLQHGENAQSLSDVALDAASLTNTLHVLEGVAADGKEWIRYERRRRNARRTTHVGE